MEQTPTLIRPLRAETVARTVGQTPSETTLALADLEKALIAKCNEIRSRLPENGWREAVDALHASGDPDLLDAYSMASSLGYLRADVRWTIWGGRL